MEKTERKHKKLSLDQIIDNIAQMNHHGKIPNELLLPSAECVFIEEADYKSYLSFMRQFKETVDCLSEEDKQVLMTFLGGPLEISDTAKALGIAERTVYYRRNRLAEKLSARLEGDYRK